MVPRAEFSSYYGRPVLQRPTWKARNIAGYFFLGGVAAGSSLLGAGADLTGRPSLRRVGRLAAAGAVGGSLLALIDDLGRPDRFLNMLRVVRPTSPMSVGSWVLAAYGPLAGLAAASEVLGRATRAGHVGRVGTVGRIAGLGAAAAAPVLASYTAVLLSDTAVPTWHEAHRELPFVFVGSAASASGGLAMALVPLAEAGPARRLATAGTVLDNLAGWQMERRLGAGGEPLRTGLAGRLTRLAKVFSIGGALSGGLLGGRSRPAAVGAGLSMLIGSICTRLGVFYAGVQAAEDPKYTVLPQRERSRPGEMSEVVQITGKVEPHL